MTIKSCAIAIFVKTPGLTPIKTRLAMDIGVQKAEFFYDKSLQMTQRQLSQLDKKVFFPYWAVTEKKGLTQARWASFPALFQGKGGLGQRIHCIYSLLIRKYNFVLLMGSDSPHLPLEHYTKTYNHLLHNDFVIGPTEDGGFYLLGGRRPIPSHIWLSTPYSVNTTYEALVQQIKKLGTVKALPPLFDIDTVRELKKLAQIKPQFQDCL